MKTGLVTLMAGLILWGSISTAHAAEIIGYPIVPKQATFYLMILALIGASMGLVGGAYACFFLADIGKKKVSVPQRALVPKEKALRGKLALQPAE
ncbi:MAG: hypothetical protein NTY64_21905 [Deltaproteobacteria bacterium]|nr:hypothetical protein [Deltaproteobacteria bacterium]